MGGEKRRQLDTNLSCPTLCAVRYDLEGRVLDTIAPAYVPDWGGVAFGRGTVFARTEDDDGQPIVLRIRIARSGNR